MRVAITQTAPVTQDHFSIGRRYPVSIVLEEPEVEIVINTSDATEAREIVRRLQGMRGFPVFPDDEPMASVLSKLDRNFPRRLDIE